MKVMSNFGEMSVESTAKIVLIMVLVVVGVIMIGYSMTGFEDVAGILESFFKGSEKAEKDPTLETAIKCVYYRCEEGCDSDIIDTLYTESFKCADFCDLSKIENTLDRVKIMNSKLYGEEHKICEDDSTRFPVVFSLSEHTMLTPIKRDSEHYLTKPLYIVEDCDSVGGYSFPSSGHTPINIDESVIDDPDEYCEDKEDFLVGDPANMATDDAYTKCLIEAGTYQLTWVSRTIGVLPTIEVWQELSLCESD